MAPEGFDPAWDVEALPAYWLQKHHSYWRRMLQHDYSGRHAYMITIVKRDDLPALGALTNPYPDDPKYARCSYSSLGLCIKKAVADFRNDFPDVKIARWVVMPDHVHLLLSFQKVGGMSLGEWVSRFKNRVNRHWHEASGRGTNEQLLPVFVEQFHDRIIRNLAQYERVKEYIYDNPRRLWIKQSHPEFFKVSGNLEVNGHIYVMMGNVALLDSPWIEAVKVSRKHTEAEKELNRLRWQANAERGGVLASPFINKREKSALEAGIQAGCGVILMTVEMVTSRWKPQKCFLELCAAGRLLVIGEKEYVPKAERGYDRNQQLNLAAAAIAEGRFRRL